MKPPHLLWSLFLLAVPFSSLAQGHAHQHGALKLDVAVEAGALNLRMESPLDNLVGFERAPRSDVERRRVDEALARLNAAQALFVIDPAAQCKLSNVTLTSAVLGLGSAPPARARDEHADLIGSFEFACQDTSKAAFIDVGLFEAFSAVKQVEVQVATPKGQFKRTLKRPARRLALTR